MWMRCPEGGVYGSRRSSTTRGDIGPRGPLGMCAVRLERAAAFLRLDLPYTGESGSFGHWRIGCGEGLRLAPQPPMSRRAGLGKGHASGGAQARRARPLSAD